MWVYRMDAATADDCFPDLRLVAFSLAALVVTEECPYADEEMSAILREISLSVCKAYQEIPSPREERFDQDAVFGAIVGRE